MKHRSLLLISVLIISVLSYAFYTQQQKLAAQQEVIEVYRGQVESASYIIQENSRFVVRSVQDLSYNFSRPYLVPLAKFSSSLQDSFNYWFNSYAQGILVDKSDIIHRDLAILELRRLLDYSQDTIANFLSEYHILHQPCGDPWLDEKMNKIISFYENFRKTLPDESSNQPVNFAQLTFFLVELNYQIQIQLAYLTGTCSSGFPVYLPEITYQVMEDGSVRCNTVFTQPSNFIADIEYLYPLKSIEFRESKQGGISWSQPNMSFDPLQIKAELKAIHPYTGEVIEVDTKDGYFLFVRPEQ